MENAQGVTPSVASKTLADLARTRERFADRMASPWWYRVGQATAVLLGTAGVSILLEAPAPLLEAVGLALAFTGGAFVAPVLVNLLQRRTGVAVQRYSGSPFQRWTIGCFLLLAVGVVIQVAVPMPYALAAIGAGLFVATLIMEAAMDTAVRRRVRTGQ